MQSMQSIQPIQTFIPPIELQATELSIGGMTCASCVAHVERALSQVPGVDSVSVNLATERAWIRHQPGVESSAFAAAVAASGYEARPASRNDDERDAARADEQRGLRRALILAAVLTVPLFAV
jgi:cation transport ATPase